MIFSGTDLELQHLYKKLLGIYRRYTKNFLKTQMVYYGLVKEEVNYLRSVLKNEK